MKKLKILLFVFLLAVSYHAEGANMNQVNVSSPETNCNGGTWNKRYYEGDSRAFRDLLGGAVDYEWVIGYSSSEVRIYNPYGSLNQKGPYIYKSNIKPKGVSQVVIASNDAGTDIRRGSVPSRGTLAGQIVFNIARKYNNGYIAGSPATYSYTLPNRNYYTKNYPDKPNFNSSIQRDNECLNIYVSYCGDGTVDSAEGETCDDGNNNNGDGCNSTCKVETQPTPSCTSLSANPSSGVAPLISNFTCSGQNTNNYKIEIKNSQGTLIKTINGKTGSYSFGAAGGYSATCYAGGKTSPSCKKTITVTNPQATPSCTSLSANPSSGVAPLTSNFTCSGQNTNNYRIEIKNAQGTVIKTINGNTGSYSFGAAGGYSATCYAGGKTSPSCRKTVTVTNPQATPSCTSLSANPSSGVAPLTSNFSCSGQNTNNYKIEIKNAQGTVIKTINGNTGSYNFGTAGGYSATCYAGGKTSPSCKKTISVSPQQATPSCTSLSANPSSGVAPLTSNFTCSGQNTNNYRIEIKNAQGTLIKTINGKTGSYKFNSAGGYSATCYAGGTTSPSCKKTVTVNPEPTPSCTNLTANPSSGIVPLTSNFSCSGQNTNDYKIEIKNSQGTVIKTINGNTGSYNFGTAGGYSATCYVGSGSGLTTSPSCRKTITVNPEPTPSCTNLTVNPNSGVAPLTSNFTCTGQNADNYRIEVQNSFGTIINIINDSTGSYNFTSGGNYRVRCYASGVTSTSCSKQVNVTQEPIWVPSIDIDKTDANTNDLDNNVGNDTQTVNKGEKAVFEITVRNNGTEDLRNIVLTDSLAPDCAGTLDFSNKMLGNNVVTFGGSGDHDDSILQVGETFSYTCEKPNTQNNYTNTAGVSGVGVNSGKTVNDSDTSSVIVKTVSPGTSCNNLTASVTNGNINFSSTLTCTGKGSSDIRIDCGNGSVKNGVGVVNSDGFYEYSSSCSYTSEGNYSARCSVGGVSSNSCEQLIVANDSGGLPHYCGDGRIDRPNMEGFYEECDGGPNCNSDCTLRNGGGGGGGMPHYCGDGRIDRPNMEGFYEECDGGPNCNSDCTLRNGGGGGGGNTNYCGDGIVQRPNENLELEECDFGSRNGVPSVKPTCDGNQPAYCSSDCKLKGSLTCPGDFEINITPTAQTYIIGDKMNLFDSYASLQTPKLNLIVNTGNGELDLGALGWRLCVLAEGDGSLRGDKVCRSLGSNVISGTKSFYMDRGALDFIGDTSKISSGTKSDSILTTTLSEPSGDTLVNAYFAGKINVRVAKPSVVTTGGGTSYVANKNISNTKDVSHTNKDKNKNVTGVGVGENISSNTTEVKNNEDIEDTIKESEDYNDKINTSTITPTISTTNSLSDFESYNGIDRAYVLRNKNFKIDSNLFAGLSGPRTYIVENGDLLINTNIEYPDNIAFVVKSGNIVINNTVFKLNGIYISIPKDSNGGEIKGGTTSTNAQLLIRGSLYGNIGDLTSKRTYMKFQNGQLNVGTIVSFGSSIFRKSAPLVSTFINEYHNATRVAQ